MQGNETHLLTIFFSVDGFGIGYIIKDDGIQFSVSSKHRQTLRYVNMLENVLMDLKRLLNSTSSVVCGGHHNHVIHPVRKEIEDNPYGDFWGESVLENRSMSRENSRSLERRDSEGGKLFSNVTKKHSIKFSPAMKVGLQLSFDESIESASASAEESFLLKKDNSIRSTDSGSGSDSA